jgi:hypothetical protein
MTGRNGGCLTSVTLDLVIVRLSNTTGEPLINSDYESNHFITHWNDVAIFTIVK